MYKAVYYCISHPFKRTNWSYGRFCVIESFLFRHANLRNGDRVACTPEPSPCPRSSLTHTHRFLVSRNSTTGNLSVYSTRLFCILCVPDDRDSACVPSPSLSSRSPSSRSSLTHTNRFLGFRNSTTARLMSAPTSAGSMYSNIMYDAQQSV